MRSKYPPSDIEEACKQFMATVNTNSQTVKPEHVLTITSFADSVYMPWVRANKQASTINGYEKMWKKHLQGHFGNRLLSDYQPHHATAFLTNSPWCKSGFVGKKHLRYPPRLFVESPYGDGHAQAAGEARGIVDRAHRVGNRAGASLLPCLLYTSDAADEED